MLDYWSQCALKPLHDYVNNRLRRISVDCTFDQSKFKPILLALSQGKFKYHSIDLSSATDRMPIALQKRVVKYLFNSEEMADAWEQILVGYPFSLTVKGKTERITYGAGQPMGAYSS